MTVAAMRAIRSAATLAEVLPQAVIQITDRGRTLLAVSRAPYLEPNPETVIPPCLTAAEVNAAADPDPAGFRRRVAFHYDGLTQLTIVHTLAASRDRQAAGDLMARLLEICVTAEMVAEIETAPPTSDPAP